MSNTNSNNHDIEELLAVLAKFGWEKTHYSTAKDLVAELDKYKAGVRRLWEILESAAVRSPVDQTIADALSELVAERNQLRDELERERLRLAACGVVAMSNTRETAERNRECHKSYKSASFNDVCAAVDREMALRERVEELESHEAKLLGVNYDLRIRLQANPPAASDLRNDLICAALTGIVANKGLAGGYGEADTMIDEAMWLAGKTIAAMRKGEA
jgi:hypothetical protein